MEFSELYWKNFPQITREEAESLHRTFSMYGVHANWVFSNSNLGENQIAQGDIWCGLYSGYWDLNQSDDSVKFKKRENCEGIILTNTCDNGKEDTHITIVPLLNADHYFSRIEAGLKGSIEKNIVTNILFLPGTTDSSPYIADFCLTCSITNKLLKKLQSENKVEKKKSLSTQGYYFFLAKLTLHFMRPESIDVKRSTPTLS